MTGQNIKSSEDAFVEDIGEDSNNGKYSLDLHENLARIVMKIQKKI